MQSGVGITVLERGPLGLGLLHAVLAEHAMTGLKSRGDPIRPKGFADGDQGDAGRIALVGRGRGRDAGAHRGKTVGDFALAHRAWPSTMTLAGPVIACGLPLSPSLPRRSRSLRFTKIFVA